ncbi:MAG TPA: 16S rRNA (cytidine(1402)-2'-O)-methyltransferase [Rhizomicrobium sp.]|nr:16S rRNA (cytidine(1402)-2'-O)-methyltransferase [Rhizomicrobium sp.]
MVKPNPGRGPAPSPLEPGLYITATPIGNARDVTLRALDVLRESDAIVAEDTRTTAKLLAIHAISRPLLAYNDHNAPRMRPAILARLARGERIALVSDAGMPLISDPGYKLVKAALAAETKVHVIPGASAALAALVLSALPTDRFLFAGFLPSARAARRSALAELKSATCSLIFFEAPQRLAESLRDMCEVLGARQAAVARELTKLHEDVRRDELCALADLYKSGSPPRGEITIVVGPPPEALPDWTHADALLDRALAYMPARTAAEFVSDALHLPRRLVYNRAIARKDSPDHDG